VKPRFRPWQLAAVLVVLCLIAVGIAVYFRRGVSHTPRELLSYMPAKNSTVVFIDLRPIRDSGLLEKFAGSSVAEEDEYKQFVAQTAFDYKTDLDLVLASSYDNNQYILLQGRFDWKSIIAYASHQGGSCRAGFCRLPSSKADRTISFYAVNSNLLAVAISPDEWAASNIKPHEKLRNAAERDGIGFELPAQPIWMAVPASVLNNQEKLPAGTKVFAKALANAERVVFSMGPAQDRFEVAMDVTCKNPEEAAILRTDLENLTGMLQKMIAREHQQASSTDLSGPLTAGVFQRVDRHVIGRWPVEKALIDHLGSGI